MNIKMLSNNREGVVTCLKSSCTIYSVNKDLAEIEFDLEIHSSSPQAV